MTRWGQLWRALVDIGLVGVIGGILGFLWRWWALLLTLPAAWIVGQDIGHWIEQTRPRGDA